MKSVSKYRRIEGYTRTSKKQHNEILMKEYAHHPHPRASPRQSRVAAHRGFCPVSEGRRKLVDSQSAVPVTKITNVNKTNQIHEYFAQYRNGLVYIYFCMWRKFKRSIMYLRGLVHLTSSSASVALQISNFTVQSEVVGLQTGLSTLGSLQVHLHALQRSLRLVKWMLNE